ncbi:porin family protein [Flavobacterium beibuense]|uniref:porin family protein n=1 Tax=Flavobacterium beibuense TaxID=657326 RepID=UPI003A8D04BA
MKKILLSAAAIMAFGFASQAQDIKFGAKAGVNFSTLSGADGDVSSRTGFHVGAVAEVKLTEQFSIQPEILYSMQGADQEATEEFMGVTYNYESSLKLGYINVPVMAKYYLMEGLSIEAGPQVGFLLSAKEEYNVEGESGEEDVKDSVSSIDFGLAGGVSYDLPVGLFFNARYYAGLSNVYDGDLDGIEYQNGVFSLSVGYKF